MENTAGEHSGLQEPNDNACNIQRVLTQLERSHLGP